MLFWLGYSSPPPTVLGPHLDWGVPHSSQQGRGTPSFPMGRGTPSFPMGVSHPSWLEDPPSLTPILPDGGIPSGKGVPPSWLGTGYPLSRPGKGVHSPIQTWDLVPPLSGAEKGVPPPNQLDGGNPPQWWTKWKHYLPSSFRCGR